MGTMTKLRENTGVILWILVIAFGVVWVLQDSGAFDNVGAQQPRNIAVVNGDPISYEEFQEAVQQQQQQLRAQYDGTLPPEMQDMAREQTFDMLVNNQLLQQEMDRLGISVTDDEVMDMVYGDNPDPLIRQQFSDSLGQIDHQLIRNMAQSPEMEQSWIQIEQYLRDKRRSEKMNQLMGATVHISDQDVREEHRRRNTSAEVRYVAQRYATISDDEVEVSDEDLRDYYDENREDFKRNRTYTIDYAAIPKEPTAEDTAQIANDLDQLRDEFAATEDDSLFLAQNASIRDYSSDYFSADQLDAPIADSLFPNPTPGEIVGPIFTSDAAHLVKVLDVRPAENPEEVQIADMAYELRASQATLNQAEYTLEDLAYYAEESGNFHEEAEEQGLAVQQTEVEDDQTTIPGLGESPEVASFLDSASEGDISDVLELGDQFVVVRVTDIEPEGYRPFEEVREEIEPRVRLQKKREMITRRMEEAMAQNDDLEALAEELGTTLRTTSDVTFDTNNVEGLGREPAFAGTVFGLDEGETSPIMEGENAAFVVQVVALDEPEPLTDDEREELRQELLQQRQREVASQWITSLRDKADIEDNRAQFQR